MEKTSVFQKRLLVSAIFTAMAATAQVSVAQDEKSIEEVTVVGSRIARASGFDGPTPVDVIDRDIIDKSGYNNLQQIFEKMPSAGNGTFSTRGNNQDSTANGAAAVSLRGMGADATLVLVNGRRVAVSAFAESITTNFVDINAIPVSAIERVEVLKDGASAIYGSDAVAGVVNIVLRKDFDGMEVSAGYGNTTDSNNEERSFSAIWGINGDNDSNLTLIFDHFSNTALMNKDRGRLGTANQSANGGEDFRSSRGYPGRFIVDGVTTIDPACPAENTAGQTCVYDYGPWNVLTPAAERTGLLLLGHGDINDSVEFFTEIGVQHNTSSARGAPTPLDEDAGLTVPVTHPNNPYVGATTLSVGRYRTVDAGAREWDIETDNVRGVFGLRGKIADWNWETTVQRARSETTQTGNRSQGWVRTDFLQQEIDAGRYNPFGGVQNPDSVIDAITTSLVRQGTSQLTAFDFTVNGELFAMSGGSAAMALGLEYREESASDTPDDQFQRALIFGTESVSAAAAAPASLSRPVDLNLEALALTVPAGKALSGTAKGTLRGAPFAVEFTAARLESFFSGQASPVALSARGAGAELNVNGRLADPRTRTESRLDLDVAGERLGDLAGWFGVSPCAEASYTARAQLVFAGPVGRVQSLEVHTGRTRLNGKLDWSGDAQGTPPQPSVHFDELAPADLEAFVPLFRPREADANESRVTIDMPVLPRPVEIPDADIRLGIARILLKPVDITDVSLFGRLRAGSLQRSPFHAGIGTTGFHGYLEPSGAVTDVVFEVDEHDSDSGNRLHELFSSAVEWAGSVAIVPLQWLFEQKLSGDGRDVCTDAKGFAPEHRQR